MCVQLPPCDADLVLQAVPATQLVAPRLLSDVQSSGSQSRQGRQSAGKASGAQRPPGQTDEEAELEAAMLMSLAETSGTDGGPANIDSDQLARVMEMQRQGGWGPEAEQRGEDDDMGLALRMSMTSHTGAEAGGASEEDEIQRAIALSLAGGTGQGVGPSQTSGGGQDGGWGARLRQQEVEEERLYKVTNLQIHPTDKLYMCYIKRRRSKKSPPRRSRKSLRRLLPCPWREPLLLRPLTRPPPPRPRLTRCTPPGPR